jgi:hypothetical protein
MQLWVVHHLVSQNPLDIWDLMLCEIEDTLAEGFKGHRQLPYAHWICFLIRLPAEIRAAISDTTTAFLEYDIRQLWALSPGSRHLDRVIVREQRYLRLQLSRTRPLRALQRQSLQTWMLRQSIWMRTPPPTALTTTTSPFLGTALLVLTTTRPVAQVQPPAQTQPW